MFRLGEAQEAINGSAGFDRYNPAMTSSQQFWLGFFILPFTQVIGTVMPELDFLFTNTLENYLMWSEDSVVYQDNEIILSNGDGSVNFNGDQLSMIVDSLQVEIVGILPYGMIQDSVWIDDDSYENGGYLLFLDVCFVQGFKLRISNSLKMYTGLFFCQP